MAVIAMAHWFGRVRGSTAALTPRSSIMNFVPLLKRVTPVSFKSCVYFAFQRIGFKLLMGIDIHIFGLVVRVAIYFAMKPFLTMLRETSMTHTTRPAYCPLGLTIRNVVSAFGPLLAFLDLQQIRKSVNDIRGTEWKWRHTRRKSSVVIRKQTYESHLIPAQHPRWDCERTWNHVQYRREAHVPTVSQRGYRLPEKKWKFDHGLVTSLYQQEWKGGGSGANSLGTI